MADYFDKTNNAEDLSPAEERLLYRISTAKGATQRGATIHGSGGALAGAAIGGAIGGTILPALGAAPGAVIGGLLGGAAGTAIGAFQGSQEEGKVAEYEKRLAKIQEAKQKENLESQARQEAFGRLLGKYSSY